MTWREGSEGGRSKWDSHSSWSGAYFDLEEGAVIFVSELYSVRPFALRNRRGIRVD